MKTLKIKPSQIKNGDLVPFSEFEVCSVEWDSYQYLEQIPVHGGHYFAPKHKALIVRFKNGGMWITSDNHEIEIRRNE